MLHKIGDRVAYNRYARDCRENAKEGDRLFETGTIDRDTLRDGEHFWWVKPDKEDPEGYLARDLRADWELMSLQEVEVRKEHPYAEHIARAKARLDAMPPREREWLVLQGSP